MAGDGGSQQHRLRIVLHEHLLRNHRVVLHGCHVGRMRSRSGRRSRVVQTEVVRRRVVGGVVRVVVVLEARFIVVRVDECRR